VSTLSKTKSRAAKLKQRPYKLFDKRAPFLLVSRREADCGRLSGCHAQVRTRDAR